jgi:hypothetical protein
MSDTSYYVFLTILFIISFTFPLLGMFLSGFFLGIYLLIQWNESLISGRPNNEL